MGQTEGSSGGKGTSYVHALFWESCRLARAFSSPSRVRVEDSSRSRASDRCQWTAQEGRCGPALHWPPRARCSVGSLALAMRARLAPRQQPHPLRFRRACALGLLFLQGLLGFCLHSPWPEPQCQRPAAHPVLGRPSGAWQSQTCAFAWRSVLVRTSATSALSLLWRGAHTARAG